MNMLERMVITSGITLKASDVCKVEITSNEFIRIMNTRFFRRLNGLD